MRGPRLNPFGDLHRAGVELMLGSDTPVTPYDPWGAIRACIRHHDPAQRLDVGTALARHAGSLRPGQPASYAVWDVSGGWVDDLPDLSHPDHPEPQCLRTVVRGHLSYQREGALA